MYNIRNKKILIIVTAVLLFVLFVAIINNGKSIKDITKNSESFGKFTDAGYYVQNGVEDKAKIAKNALEAYLKQDIKETKGERDKRLSEYFVTKSNVFQESIYFNQSGKVTSVISCELQESGWCLSVIANVSISDKQAVLRKYWITLEKQDDNLYKVNGIGVWE